MAKEYKKNDTKEISGSFTVNEFSCKGSGCCSKTLIDPELVQILQKIRDHFEKPVIITSGYRCEKHNASVRGETSSRHLTGTAADIVVKGVNPADVAWYAEQIGVKGIGLYETNADGYFVHVDTRKNKSFWYGQDQKTRVTFQRETPVETPVETVNKTTTIALPVLRMGDEGDTVRSMQLMLIGMGYDCGTKKADSNFGSDTKTAVEDFQREHDLDPDGVCGNDTWCALLGV